MTKKCIYCKTEISADSVLDVCKRCGDGVWGPKMHEAIVKECENARASGNLNQGSITQKF
jgi:hypothetical protein